MDKETNHKEARLCAEETKEKLKLRDVIQISVYSAFLLVPFPDLCSCSQTGSVASLDPHSFSFDHSLMEA